MVLTQLRSAEGEEKVRGEMVDRLLQGGEFAVLVAAFVTRLYSCGIPACDGS